MKKRFAQLQRIDHNQNITEETHGEFLHHLQGALLLALCEQGRLSAAQYQDAAERLARQSRRKTGPQERAE